MIKYISWKTLIGKVDFWPFGDNFEDRIVSLCLVYQLKQFHPIFWDEKKSLKMVWNGLKMIYKNDIRIV